MCTRARIAPPPPPSRDPFQNTNCLLGSLKEKQIDTFFIANDDNKNNSNKNISRANYIPLMPMLSPSLPMSVGVVVAAVIV